MPGSSHARARRHGWALPPPLPACALRCCPPAEGATLSLAYSADPKALIWSRAGAAGRGRGAACARRRARGPETREPAAGAAARRRRRGRLPAGVPQDKIRVKNPIPPSLPRVLLQAGGCASRAPGRGRGSRGRGAAQHCCEAAAPMEPLYQNPPTPQKVHLKLKCWQPQNHHVTLLLLPDRAARGGPGAAGGLWQRVQRERHRHGRARVRGADAAVPRARGAGPWAPRARGGSAPAQRRSQALRNPRAC